MTLNLPKRGLLEDSFNSSFYQKSNNSSSASILKAELQSVIQKNLGDKHFMKQLVKITKQY